MDPLSDRAAHGWNVDSYWIMDPLSDTAACGWNDSYWIMDPLSDTAAHGWNDSYWTPYQIQQPMAGMIHIGPLIR